MTGTPEPDGWLGGQRSQPLLKGNWDWTLLTVKGTMAPGATTLEILLESENNPTGTAWFDDVQFGPVN